MDNDPWDVRTNLDTCDDPALDSLLSEDDLTKRRETPRQETTMSNENDLPARVGNILSKLAPADQNDLTTFLATVAASLGNGAPLTKGVDVRQALLTSLEKSAQADFAKVLIRYFEDYATQVQNDVKLDVNAKRSLTADIAHCVDIISKLIAADAAHESPNLDPNTEGKLGKGTGESLGQRLMKEALAQKVAASGFGRLLMEREMERRADATPMRKT
jgi:hypothetical protein